MTPEFEDPNNHAPKVSSGDEWEDLDSPATNLTPPRKEPGLPPKRPTREPAVKLHESKSKPAEPDPESADEEPAGENAKAKKRASRKTAAKKTPAKKSAGKVLKTKGRKSAKPRLAKKTPALETIPEAEPEVPESTTTAEKLVLPPAPEGKRFRVNQIGGDPTAHQPLNRPVRSATQVAASIPQENNEEVARRRRRFVRGERGDWGEEKGRGSAKWMALTGIGVIALVILAVVASQPGNRGKERNQSMFSQLAPAENTEKESPIPDDNSMLEMLTNGQEAARDLYAAYAKAKSPEDLAPLIFDAEQTMPLIRKDWKPIEDVPKDWRPGDDSHWTVADREETRYGRLDGTDSGYLPYTAYFQSEDGELKLDWKATTGYSSAEFSELKQGSGDASEIRTLISRAEFFTFALPEEKYLSFRLMAPDGEVNLWGYIEKDTALGEEVSELFLQSQITGEIQTEIQVVVSLEPGPEEGLPAQWMIEDLRGLTWLDEKE